jgi:hypothetical protein
MILNNPIQKFYDGFINDNQLLEALDDAVHTWHITDNKDEIWEHLGMCKTEYGIFMKSPKCFLKYIKRQRDMQSFDGEL